MNPDMQPRGSEEENDLERRGDQFTENSQRIPSPIVASGCSSFSKANEKRRDLFSFMADFPWPFLLIIPITFAIIIGFGWTTDDKVEAKIGRLWIKETGSYAQDQNYAESLGVGDLAQSAFAAMAISRDGKNILTTNRLEEIRDRMEQAESTTVRFGFTFVCGRFRLSCFRIHTKLTLAHSFLL